VTPQGRAIRQASIRFGDGRTLPFTPCKKGYIPVIVFPIDKDTTTAVMKFMYACPLHDTARRQRVASEGGKFRVGEVNLNEMWSLLKKKNEVATPKPSLAFSSTGVQKRTKKKTMANNRTTSAE
jgi:hypothetical protein